MFSLFSVSALDFDADLVATKNKITIDQVAEFTLTIYNYETTRESFRIKNTDYLLWDIYTKPRLSPITIDVPPKSNASVNLFIRPIPSYVAGSGSHFVNLNVISQSSDESISNQGRIGIISSDEITIGYVPTVIISTDFPSEIVPGQEKGFKITLNNQNKLQISDAQLILSSSLINEDVKVNIAPQGETVVDVKSLLDSKTKPVKDSLTINLMYKGKKVDEFIQNYEVVSYSKLIEDSVEEKSFLRRSEEIVFTNNGNVKVDYKIKVATSQIKRFFGSTNPEAVVEKDGDGTYNYVWNVELEPFESFNVKVSENYLGVVILIVVILLIGLLVFLKRSPIIIRKDIIDTESDEGGLSKIKVLINIKNRSKKKMRDLSIVDKIPKLLDIDKNTILGSLKPSKIKRNPKHETLILWSLEELMPGEERVINYHLKANLKILGGLTLQPAMLKFRQKDNEIKVRSNISFVRV